MDFINLLTGLLISPKSAGAIWNVVSFLAYGNPIVCPMIPWLNGDDRLVDWTISLGMKEEKSKRSRAMTHICLTTTTKHSHGFQNGSRLLGKHPK